VRLARMNNLLVLSGVVSAAAVVAVVVLRRAVDVYRHWYSKHYELDNNN
jgi:hypothetical protein